MGAVEIGLAIAGLVVLGVVAYSNREHWLPGMKDRRIASTARRMSPRMKTLKGALIVTPTGIPTICIVRDFSETGACLEVHSPIPHNVFELVFDDSDGWPPVRVA